MAGQAKLTGSRPVGLPWGGVPGIQPAELICERQASWHFRKMRKKNFGVVDIIDRPVYYSYIERRTEHQKRPPVSHTFPWSQSNAECRPELQEVPIDRAVTITCSTARKTKLHQKYPDRYIPCSLGQNQYKQELAQSPASRKTSATGFDRPGQRFFCPRTRRPVHSHRKASFNPAYFSTRHADSFKHTWDRFNTKPLSICNLPPSTNTQARAS